MLSGERGVDHRIEMRLAALGAAEAFSMIGTGPEDAEPSRSGCDLREAAGSSPEKVVVSA